MRKYTMRLCCVLLLILLAQAGSVQAAGQDNECAIQTGVPKDYGVVVVIATVLAALSAFASAFAACKSNCISEQSLQFQKKIAKYNSYHQKLASVLTKIEILKCFKEVSDEKFISIPSLYLEIKSDLRVLTAANILKANPSSFFSASTFPEALAQVHNYPDEINQEIIQIEKALGEIFT